jgi:hypothetical protein
VSSPVICRDITGVSKHTNRKGIRGERKLALVLRGQKEPFLRKGPKFHRNRSCPSQLSFGSQVSLTAQSQRDEEAAWKCGPVWSLGAQSASDVEHCRHSPIKVTIHGIRWME